MFGTIIKHHKECVEFYALSTFKKKIISHYRQAVKDDETNSFPNIYKVDFCKENRGVIIYECGKDSVFVSWNDLAVDMGWFDEAEIVTDKDEKEKVMVWLNVD